MLRSLLLILALVPIGFSTPRSFDNCWSVNNKQIYYTTVHGPAGPTETSIDCDFESHDHSTVCDMHSTGHNPVMLARIVLAVMGDYLNVNYQMTMPVARKLELQSVGTKMIHAVVKISNACGYQGRLHVIPYPSVKGFYEKLGFIPISEGEEELKLPRSERQKMRKSLSSIKKEQS